MDTANLFEDEKKESEKAEDVAAEPVKEEHPETEFLLAKSIRCPVCDQVFRTKRVKTGRVKRLEPDFDLRPKFQYIDTNKYDVDSCPRCGYTAINRYFEHVSPGQIKLLEQGVRSKFKPSGPVDMNEPLVAFTYEEAIERYKLALYNTVVKKGHNSEKAYECLKLAWLYRGLAEKLEASEDSDSESLEQARQAEDSYYAQAYEGFIKAVASEHFPMCGMDESTVNILLAAMAFKLEKYEVASKLVAKVITSRTAGSAAKNRAHLLKEEIIQKLHGDRA